MRITKLSYFMKISVQDYGSRGLSLSAELERNDNISDCYQKLKEMAESQLNGALPQMSNNQKNKKNSEKKPDLMTNAQKRYLFQLLAELGIEGEAAHENLKETFGVKTLTRLTKKQASDKIKELRQELEGS